MKEKIAIEADSLFPIENTLEVEIAGDPPSPARAGKRGTVGGKGIRGECVTLTCAAARVVVGGAAGTTATHIAPPRREEKGANASASQCRAARCSGAKLLARFFLC